MVLMMLMKSRILSLTRQRLVRRPIGHPYQLIADVDARVRRRRRNPTFDVRDHDFDFETTLFAQPTGATHKSHERFVILPFEIKINYQCLNIVWELIPV